MALETFDFPLEVMDGDDDRAVVISRFENDREQRRLKGKRKIVKISWRSSVRTKAQLDAILTFYDDRDGPLEKFLFTHPVTDEALQVRFVGSVRWRFTGGVYVASGAFQVLYEDE